MTYDTFAPAVFDRYTASLWENLVDPNLARIIRKVRQARALGFNAVVFFRGLGDNKADFELFEASELNAGRFRDNALTKRMGIWIGFPPCMFDDGKQRLIFLSSEFVERLYALQDKAYEHIAETIVRVIGQERLEVDPPQPEPESDKPEEKDPESPTRRFMTPGYGEGSPYLN